MTPLVATSAREPRKIAPIAIIISGTDMTAVAWTITRCSVYYVRMRVQYGRVLITCSTIMLSTNRIVSVRDYVRYHWICVRAGGGDALIYCWFWASATFWLINSSAPACSRRRLCRPPKETSGRCAAPASGAATWTSAAAKWCGIEGPGNLADTFGAFVRPVFQTANDARRYSALANRTVCDWMRERIFFSFDRSLVRANRGSTRKLFALDWDYAIMQTHLFRR